MIYREATCQTALSKSTLPGLDYSLNPYTGCEHACSYCYAPATLRYAGPEPWGTFVTAKTNIPVVLERESRKAKPGVVGLSTVTDPYQPIERKKLLTRCCLEVLQAKQFALCVQTKSSLVVRDLDLLAGFRDVEIGFTITVADDVLAAAIEPGASPASERLKAMKKVSAAGIRTWAFIGPLLPGFLTPTDAEGLVRSVCDAGASRILFDRLRLKPGTREALLSLKSIHPEFAVKFDENLASDPGQYARIEQAIIFAAKALDIPCESAF